MRVSRYDLAALAALLVWVIYHLLRLGVGLVLHPYRTAREIMRGRWFVPMIFLPTGLLMWILLSGRIGAWVVEVPEAYRDLLGMGLATVIVSIGLWQVLLFYLGVRFFVGMRR